ncbi:hypothetical protein Anas_14114 [Armadillidium nasatum]|uniref:Uncharacterized protein n=1 Tax=Armadillidium nasatum TaxID=96803 RepID=A0A5N5T4U0_9CRUS|nr:hypothetical protein Anas_14114 [Armadillidium nasatum]
MLLSLKYLFELYEYSESFIINKKVDWCTYITYRLIMETRDLKEIKYTVKLLFFLKKKYCTDKLGAAPFYV